MTTTSRTRRLLPTALLVAGVVVLSGTTGAVAGAQITGADVKDGSLTGRDIRDTTIGYADTTNALDQQHRRVGGYRVVRRSKVVPTGDNIGGLTATCPLGTKVLGYGGYWDQSVSAMQVRPLSDGRSIQAYGQSSVNNDVARLVVYCGRTVAS